MPRKNLTKIISTAGPACEDSHKLKSLITKGTDIFRFNLKHNTLNWHQNIINLVFEISNELNVNTGIMVDIPSIDYEGLKEFDHNTLKKIDFLALSYTKSKKDIIEIKDICKELGLKVFIVAKIEDGNGLDNIDEIIDTTDGVMIARGDLGSQVPYEQVTYYQKEIIKKCRNNSKPVIVATQMLESMIKNASPTRAEAADVSNAVFDETDCVMLSAETATGKYPEESVNALRKISVFNESKKGNSNFLPDINTQAKAIVNAAISIVNNKNAVSIDKILVFTESGYTARVFSSFRPNIPTIALSEILETVKRLTMSYGIVPFYFDFPEGNFNYPQEIGDFLKNHGLLNEGDTVLLIHGKRWRDPGNTNSIVVLTV